MVKKKFRVSYSLLNCWSQGKVDEALAMYFHRPGFKSEAMQIGSAIHEDIASRITRTGQLPSWLSSIPLVAPKPEHKLIVSYNELFDLSAVIDCLDVPNLFEWKTGVTDSNEWAGTYQIPFYFLVCELAGIPVEKAYLVHYNQMIKRSDWTQVWNGVETKARARNFIDSIAPEIHEYFKSHNLLEIER